VFNIRPLTILFCLTLVCFGCRKTAVPTNSKFRIQPLNYKGLYYLNTIRLTNGNYVTIDQDLYLDSMNIGMYDANANLVLLKKYAFPTGRYLSSGISYENGFVVAGFTSNWAQYVIMRFDANANIIWDSTYTANSNNSDFQSVICCTSLDGNILIAGSQGPPPLSGSTSPSTSPLIQKINGQTGAIIDTPINISGIAIDTFNCIATSIYERSDGVYLSGYFFYLSDVGWTFGSLFCLKTQEDGNTQWFNNEPFPPANKYATGNPFINSYNIAETNSGPIVLVSSNASQFAIASIENLYSYWYLMIGYNTVFSYDPNTGNKIDSVTFSINNKSEQPIIHPTNDGGYILAATGNIYLNSFTAPTVILLIKMDAQFNIQWQKTFNPDGGEFIVFGVFPLTDGYEITGQSNSIVNNKSLVGTFLMKTDLQGNIRD